MSKRKRYEARIHLGGGIYHWVGRFATKRERDDAKARERVRLQELGALGTGQAVREMTVRQFYERFMRDYERHNKASSVDTAKSQMKPLLDKFGHRPIGSVTRTEAKDWAAQAKPHHLPVAVTLFNTAVSDDVIPRNPFRGLGRRTKGRSDEAPPTEKELQKLLDACSILGHYAPRMRALLKFAAYTGMRPSELFQLRWRDIDLQHNRIYVSERLYRGTVDEPKYGKKLIALTPPAREALHSTPRMSPEFVFVNKHGNRLASSSLSFYWAQVKARAGLDFDFYLATKHYCVHYLWTHLNLSDRAIAAQMGWTVEGVHKLLRVYGHGDIGALDEIDAAFSRNVRPLRAIQDADETQKGAEGGS